MSVTADFTFNNNFKLVPVAGFSGFPLAKQDYKILNVCVFQLISIDFDIAPLNSYS